jgi:NAD(P)H-dependent flavin oxidoreductase YrpB (nitropropane dioxygenase family)
MWDNRPVDLGKELIDENSEVVSGYRQAQKLGDADVVAVLCGQGVGEIGSIDPAFDIVNRINEETMAVVRSLPRILQD